MDLMFIKKHFHSLIFSLSIILNLSSFLLAHISDLCEHESVDSAAHLIFEDNVERYFVSNGHYYWLLNLTSEIPNEKMALRIPYDFEPDVALLKDSRKCPNGYRSLLLIQMKSIPYSNEAEWFTLEMKIGRWNSSGAIFWNEINKIAHCDLKMGICTTTDSYFKTMSFDFKTKLDSAFGTIGDIAYFIQGEKVYKVLYKNQCIGNPYTEVIAYPGISIGTTTTAALSIEDSHENTTLILFDKDVHFRMNIENLYNVNFNPEIVEPTNWKINNNNFFPLCKNSNLLGISLMFQDIFSGSKRHYYLRRITLIALIVIFISLILLTMVIFINSFKSKHREVEPKEDMNQDNVSLGKLSNSDQERIDT